MEKENWDAVEKTLGQFLSPNTARCSIDYKILLSMRQTVSLWTCSFDRCVVWAGERFQAKGSSATEALTCEPW